MSKVAKVTIQKWGKSLAVRIPAAIARSVHFVAGQPVELTVVDANVVVKPVARPKLSLSQKLAIFDSSRHSGEVLLSDRIGAEIC